MARRSIAANAEKQGVNDVIVTSSNEVKFVSENTEQHFVVKIKDKDGNQVYHTTNKKDDPEQTIKVFSFTPIYPRNPVTGKPDRSKGYSIYVANKDILGVLYDDVIAELEKLCKNKINKIYTDEEFWKRRNPEAYNVAKAKVELENRLDVAQDRIKELETRLGLQRK